jgi:hypothetical protein
MWKTLKNTSLASASPNFSINDSKLDLPKDTARPSLARQKEAKKAQKLLTENLREIFQIVIHESTTKL